jgi:hypothetical protein
MLSVFGRLAQLGERLVYTQEVGGSIPSPPIAEDHSPVSQGMTIANGPHSGGPQRSELARFLVGGLGPSRSEWM